MDIKVDFFSTGVSQCSLPLTQWVNRLMNETSGCINSTWTSCRHFKKDTYGGELDENIGTALMSGMAAN